MQKKSVAQPLSHKIEPKMIELRFLPRLRADTRNAFLFWITFCLRGVQPSEVTVAHHRASSEATLSLEFVATLNATAAHYGDLRAMVLRRQ